MALLRTKEIRAMDAAAREKKLRELRDELHGQVQMAIQQGATAALGGAVPSL